MEQCTDAKLVVACTSGKATVNLRLSLGEHAPQQNNPPRKRKPGPSRIRRNERRAKARADAAVEASKNPLPSTTEAAVQAVTEHQNVSTDMNDDKLPQKTITSAEFGTQFGHSNKSALALDVFCPDKDYFQLQKENLLLARNRDGENDMENFKTILVSTLDDVQDLTSHIL